jgi:DNA-binding NarL/FixJ family response regulator
MEATHGGVVTAVVVDREDAFADRLSLLLRKELGLKVLAIAGTLEAGVAACASHRPGLLVIDADLSSTCGLPILDSLAISSPTTAIVLVSGRSPCISCPFTLRPEIRIDVRLSKDLPQDELTKAVRRGLAGLGAAGRKGSPHA